MSVPIPAEAVCEDDVGLELECSLNVNHASRTNLGHVSLLCTGFHRRRVDPCQRIVTHERLNLVELLKVGQEGGGHGDDRSDRGFDGQRVVISGRWSGSATVENVPQHVVGCRSLPRLGHSDERKIIMLLKGEAGCMSRAVCCCNRGYQEDGPQQDRHRNEKIPHPSLRR